MEELEDEGIWCFSGGWDEVDGGGLDLSGRRLWDVGGEVNEDALGGHVDGCDEGMDVGQEDGLEGLFFFLLWWMDVSDQLFLFLKGAEETGSEVLIHVFFIQVQSPVKQRASPERTARLSGTNGVERRFTFSGA